MLFPLLLLGAATGWCMTKLFTLGLFSPKTPKKLFTYEIQGAVPKLKQELETHLPDLIDEKELEDEVGELAEKKMDSFLEKVKVQLPLAGPFLQGPLADNLKKQAKEEFIGAIPELKKRLTDRFKEQCDEDQIEQWLKKRFRKELLVLQLLGLVIGSLFGCITWLLFFS